MGAPNREKLTTERESDNLEDKYAVCVKKSVKVVGNLPLGKTGIFSKSFFIFYFLRADEYGSCELVVTGKPINLGDGVGMQVPCRFNFSWEKEDH